MLGFTRERPTTPVDVVDHSNYWSDVLAEQAADRDAAIFATAEDARAGIDGDTAARAYRWFAVVTAALMLAFVAWQLVVHA